MTDRKRSKHVGFAAQREFCRNNKHTYTEKFKDGVVANTLEPVLMCNYPFPDPYHKKGVCRANTCTDMREIPEEIVYADEKIEVPQEGQNTPGEVVETVPEERKVPTCDELDANTLADSGDMPCPSNE